MKACCRCQEEGGICELNSGLFTLVGEVIERSHNGRVKVKFGSVGGPKCERKAKLVHLWLANIKNNYPSRSVMGEQEPE